MLTDELKTEYRTVDLCSKKIYTQDFSNQNLSRLKLRKSLFFQCNFDGADMSETDCEGSEFPACSFRETNCNRTNFKDAKLCGAIFEPRDCFGATFTMHCKTFDGMIVSPMWWYMWLMFATMMKPRMMNTADGEEVQNKLIHTIGPDRYVKLNQLLKRREM